MTVARLQQLWITNCSIAGLLKKFQHAAETPELSRRFMRYERPGIPGRGVGVSSPDELRSCAVDCARLARSASDPHDKARLLNMAHAWTALADRIERIGRERAHAALVTPSEPASASHDGAQKQSTSGQT